MRGISTHGPLVPDACVGTIFIWPLPSLHRPFTFVRAFLTCGVVPRSWRSPQPVQHRSQLRETIHVAPISITLESAQGSNASHYATRLSTVLLVGRDGQVLFVERDIWTLEQNKVTRSEPPSQRVFRFQLEKEAAT